jgi:hypothetical protein
MGMHAAFWKLGLFVSICVGAEDLTQFHLLAGTVCFYVGFEVLTVMLRRVLSSGINVLEFVEGQPTGMYCFHLLDFRVEK